MADADVAQQQPEMTTGKAIGIYSAMLIAEIVLITLAAKTSWFPGIIAFIAYFIFGFMLNRVVLRGLIEWHPTYNTLENVSSAKLGMMGLWPIRYPGLFFQLLVSKHL